MTMTVMTGENLMCRFSCRIIALLCLTFCFPLFIFAQDVDYRVDPAGQFGGQATAALVEGDLVYLGQGAGLAVVDRSGDMLTRRGFLNLDAEILAMQKHGAVLYCLLNNSAGLQGVDISDPEALQKRGRCDVETYRTAGMALGNNVLYIAAERGGFQIVDVSDPTAPFVASTVNSFYPSDIAIRNGYAFALTSTTSPAKLQVFDLSDPLNPVYRAQADALKGRTLTLAGDLALVACNEYDGGVNGMRVFDISQPLALFETGFAGTSNRTYTVTAFETHAYLGGKDSVWVADITDPSSPAIIAGVDIQGSRFAEHHGVYADASSLVLFSRNSDHPLEILNVSDAAHPQADRTLNSPHNIQSLKAHQEQLYVSSTQYLFVYDVSDRRQPAVKDLYTEYAGLSHLKLYNGLLTGARISDLYLLNIDDARAITLAAQHRIESGMIMDYSFSGSYAFVQTDAQELITLDLSDPENIQRVADVVLAGRPRAVLASGNWLWSAYGGRGQGKGVEAFDISTPAEPIRQATLEFDSTPTCLFLDSDTLFVGSIVSDTQFKLTAYLVTNPADPWQLAEATGTGKIWDVEIRDNAILAAVEGGSVIRFVLDHLGNTLVQVDECPSPGSLQITTTPADDQGVGTLYTAEGVSWETFSGTQQKSGIDSPAGGATPGAGNYGVAIQTFKVKKPVQVPTLTLGKSGAEDTISTCVCDSCEYTILPFVLTADRIDDWQVLKVGFQSAGTGVEDNDLHQIYLYQGKQRLSNSAYLRDDGFIVLEVDKIIPKGQSLNLRLVYEFEASEKWAPIPDQLRTFQAQTKMEWVSADPVNFSSGVKEPPTPISGELRVGRVWNENSGEWFQSIQAAIDDEDTQDKHFIKICPSVFVENVVVNKSLSLSSFVDMDRPKIVPADKTKHTTSVVWDEVMLDGLHITAGNNPPGSMRSTLGNQETAAVYIDNDGEHFSAFDCLLQGGDVGLLLDDVEDVHIANVEITGASLDGILMRNHATGVHIGRADLGNHIHQNGRCGVRIQGEAPGFISLMNNLIEHNGIGVHVVDGPSYITLGSEDYSAPNTIRKNGMGVVFEGKETTLSYLYESIIIDNDSSGIHIGSGASFIEIGSPKVQEKHAISGNGTGISMDNVLGVKVYNQLITDNKRYGIRITGESKSVVIGGEQEKQANRIAANHGPGIAMEGTLHRVSHTTLSKNTGAGIIVSGSGHVVQTCTVEKTGSDQNVAGQGCGLWLNNSTLCTVKDNSIIGNRTGVLIEKGADNILAENLVKDSNLAGVKIAQSGKNNLENNTLTHNEAGITVLKGSENKIHGNAVLQNRTQGVEFYDSHKNRMSRNEVHDNSMTGLLLNRADRNQVSNNRISNNRVGIAEYSCTDNAFQNNILEGHTKALRGCGYHAILSRSDFIGNTITQDQGDALYLEQGSFATIEKNNIYDNHGSGLTHADTQFHLPVGMNWWGHTSGPGGVGSGSGQEIFGNVSVERWALAPIDLVISAGNDTVYLPAGSADSLVLSAQNWGYPDDGVGVSVVDSLGWLNGPVVFSLVLSDSLGADTSLVLNPAMAAAGTVNKLTARATSTMNPDLADSAVVWIRIYESVIDTIIVQPDSVELAPGDSVAFVATAYDRFHSRLPMRFDWQATGGEIDSSGRFYAGAMQGWAGITAVDSSGTHQGVAHVRIRIPTGLDTDQKPGHLPEHYALYQNHPNPFNPSTTIRFEVPERSHVTLRIFDVLGKQVKVLVDREIEPGLHTVVWDGHAGDDSDVASGIYFYVMQAGAFVHTRKAIYLR
ncbi:T9SS type A sorting domain-containing protein [candidate division KSB1 bacterium]|nr:T9SS type A sorting domain-containing protein [candidate division KSB1 bacterium]